MDLTKILKNSYEIRMLNIYEELLEQHKKILLFQMVKNPKFSIWQPLLNPGHLD